MLSNLLKLFRLKENFSHSERIAIFEKIEAGDVHSIRSMLEKKPSLTNALDSRDFRTALGLIIEKMDEELVLELLQKSPWIAHCPDANVNMPLYFAACAGRLRILEKLLAVGADVNISGGGGTALHAAASHGHIDCMRLLLKHGANVNSLRGEDETPLIMAAQDHQVEAIDLLIEAGADVNKRREMDGQTPLLWCCPMFPIGAAHLLRHGADVNASNRWHGQTALQNCISYSPEIATLLVLKGADPNVKVNNDNLTALEEARRLQTKTHDAEQFPRWETRLAVGTTELQKSIINRDDAVKFRSMAESDIDGCDKASNTNLHYAAANNRSETAKVLLQRGANPDSRNQDGRTPLHLAAMAGAAAALEVLLAANADHSVRDSQGFTALNWAKRWKHEDLVETLQHAGAFDKYIHLNIHDLVRANDVACVTDLLNENPLLIHAREDYGFAPLHCAGSAEMVGLLLSKEAGINAIDCGGNSALHWAARKDNVTIALSLLEEGANVQALNFSGDTPMALAGGAEMRRLLSERGADSKDLIVRNLSILDSAISDTGLWYSWRADGDKVSIDLHSVQMLGTNESQPSQLTIEMSRVSHLIFFSNAPDQFGWIDELRHSFKSGSPAGHSDGIIVRGDATRPYIAPDGFTTSNLSIVSSLYSHSFPNYMIGDKSNVNEKLKNTKFIAFRAPPVGLIVIAEELKLIAGGEPISLLDIEDAHSRWWHYWKDYWNRKNEGDTFFGIDIACEATIPLAAESA